MNDKEQYLGEITKDNYSYKVIIKGNETSGFGEVYDAKGIKIFEGYFANGKANGHGKLFNHQGEITFEGEFKNGLKKQKIKYNIHSFIDFQGDYINENIIYDGTWMDNQRHGYGIMYSEPFDYEEIEQEIEEGNDSFETVYNVVTRKITKYSYEGEWKNNLPEGLGKVYDKDKKLWYEGEMKGGDFFGYGKVYDGNGKLRFKGEILGISTGTYYEIYDPDPFINKTRQVALPKLDEFNLNQIPVWLRYSNWKGILNYGEGEFYNGKGEIWFTGDMRKNIKERGL
ncbi:hypothetical protein [Priestia megaterium]|uniref:hypothetical protein n=1 Tax=Priestia megaterium TaxID=1404 RepID=UPI00203C5861|nr:hypothetical protein [Priestia megaterium]MCM3541755.1 hypothetical protein [Priestia megaterium]